jgi:hypothetical protein
VDAEANGSVRVVERTLERGEERQSRGRGGRARVDLLWNGMEKAGVPYVNFAATEG